MKLIKSGITHAMILFGHCLMVSAMTRRQLSQTFDASSCQSGILGFGVDCSCAERKCGSYCSATGADSYVLDDCGDGFLWDNVYCNCYEYIEEPEPEPEPQSEVDFIRQEATPSGSGSGSYGPRDTYSSDTAKRVHIFSWCMVAFLLSLM